VRSESDEADTVALNPTTEGDGSLVRRLRRQVVHVVDHSDKQIKKELATVLHLILHRAAALEGVSSTDDEREVVRTEFRVVVGGIGICVTSGSQDSRALDA
jgi:hypothetical protein